MVKAILKKVFHIFNMDLVRKRKISLDTNLYYHLFHKDSIEKKKFYNIGAGSFKHPFWTNIDFKSDWYEESLLNSNFINFDLFSSKNFPIEENSAEIVYSSHTLEHINDQAAQNLLNEAYRILKKNGILRLTMPDIDLEYRACLENDKNYFYMIDMYSKAEHYNRIKIRNPMNTYSLKQIFLYRFAAQASELHIDNLVPKISDTEFAEIFSTMPFAEALDYCTSRCSIDVQKQYPGNHINWWNETKTKKMLKTAGFTNNYRSGFGQSFSPILRNTDFFDNTHPKLSLFIEAKK